MNAREFATLPIKAASDWVMKTLGDLHTRITTLWHAAKHDPEVISVRNDMRAKELRIQAASTRWNAKELQRSYEALTDSEARIKGLENKYLRRSQLRRGFDEVLQGYESLINEVESAGKAMKQWSSRLSNLYDNNGSNREFISGINGCRMFMQALETLLNKLTATRDEIQSRMETGDPLKPVQALLTLSQNECKQELDRVANHVKSMQKLARRYDVKRKTLHDLGALQRWQPNVQRAMSLPHEDEELAEIVESALMFGAPAFPDPATEILEASRRQHVLASAKQMLSGIMKSKLADINTTLPSVTATVSGVQNNSDDLEDQCHSVQSLLISGLSDKNIPGWSAASVSDTRSLILASTAAATPVYRTKVLAWVKHYVR